MKKLEKIFEGIKGLILFYIIVAILTLMITNKVNDINSQAEVEQISEETYYA